VMDSMLADVIDHGPHSPLTSHCLPPPSVPTAI
jgi:hypothetical protein